ncbi:uncharacterized protein cubi_02583 [Cryptosporidium ubiquitum]|uniref:Uncharacterized protein n=1 Tax=Cryptosporidium ubiquitum TaxID=857276 RepID=A0A1J4MIS3_9CRYT|nr:uncharacterized protein cubi_02583 [Cryptosporidium ubiquitum]OII73371.1 hypothetical protein cubi_02583 [Cryptosporidium ubiquitum]
MPQSSTLWNQPYSRELIMDHPEGIDWISQDGCLENIKEPHFVDYNDPNSVSMDDPLGNNFYDCTDLDDSFHNYLIKGLMGENIEGGSSSSNLNDISTANSSREQNNTSGSIGHTIDNICHSINHSIEDVGIGVGALGVSLGGVGVGKEFESMGCSYETHSHSHPLVDPSEKVMRDQNTCYKMPVASSNLGISGDSDVFLGSPSGSVALTTAPSTSTSSSSSSSSSSASSSSSSSSSPSLQLNSGLSPISLPPRAVPPVNISQSLMTPTTAVSSSSPNQISFSQNSGQTGSKLVGFDISYQIENTQKRARIEPEESIRIDIFDDGLMGSEMKLGDHQIVDLDSSKGRRWSNNSTTSTISSNFSINTNDGGCVSHINDNTNDENLGMLNHDFQQDKFCSTENLGSQKPKMVDQSYEMGVIEDENYSMGNQMEGEFFMNSDNYLTEEEKLKLRRRGRRRRPGEIEAWKTIIPRTTVDEAEHFVQTSQYRMRHVYRDPRAVSFVYRCVQHVDCQYEMRIYLISHETCYVQHRGYHTEEKQKYKRPDELIRKGLPPKSVIDHAIQIYPEVADQSNISVLYRQITNRQQPGGLPLNSIAACGGTSRDPEHGMNSPFGMVPSNERAHANQQNTDIDLHVDNSNGHIQKFEHTNLPGLDEVSDFVNGFKEEAKRENEDQSGSIYYKRDEEQYMNIEQGEEVGDTEGFQNINPEADYYEAVKEDNTSILEKIKEVGLDIVGQGESEPEVTKKSETEIKIETKNEAKAGKEERKHNIPLETEKPRGEAKIMEEKASQEKTKMPGIGFLGRPGITTEGIGGENKKGNETEKIESESKGREESKVIEDAEVQSEKIKIKAEDTRKKKHIKAIPSLEHESKKADQVQATSLAINSASITTATANTTESVSSDISNSTTKTNLYANGNDTLPRGEAEDLEKAKEFPKEILEESTGSKGNATVVDPASNTKGKPKSLKKASSPLGKDKTKKKLNKTEETALKKVPKEASKGESSELPKPGRLGSSRGDFPRSAKAEKPKQEKVLKLPLTEKKESETTLKDRYKCLNVNTSILDPLIQTCPTGLEHEGLKSMRGRAGKENQKQTKEPKQNVKPLKNPKTNRKNFPHPIWLEIVEALNKICTKFENDGNLISKKIPAKDTQISKSSISSKLNNNATTSTTTKTSQAGETKSLPIPARKLDTRSLTSTEKEKSPEHESKPIKPQQHDTKREGGKKSNEIISWGGVVRMMELLSIPDTYIRGTAKRALKFNIYIYKLYTNIYKGRILRRAQKILFRIPIINKSQIIRDKHFLGAYTVFGSLLSVLLLLVITGFHRRLCIENSENGLEEAETIKKLGLVGGKIKMLNSHISNSDRGVEKVVFSEDPTSICNKILESRSLDTKIQSGIDHSEERTDSKNLTSILDLTAKLEENNEILLHLSNGLAKCAQSLTI